MYRIRPQHTAVISDKLITRRETYKHSPTSSCYHYDASFLFFFQILSGMVIALATDLINRHHTDSQIHRGLLTRGWWRRFIRRHPSLTMKTPAALEQSRAQQAGPHIFNEWFKLLQTTMQELKITSGSQIWNADETGFKLDPLPRKVVCDKKQKNLSQQVQHTNDHITVHICVNAAGRALPPHVIYSRKQLRSGLKVAQTTYSSHACPRGR